MRWIFLVTVLFTGCVSATKQEGRNRVQVMTYNIHHGEGIDGKVDLVRIAKLITDNKIDLVALQEVDRNTERTAKIDMPAELARLTGFNVAFGSNLELQGGQYGNVILSRFPIRSFTNYWLPKIVPGEQRGLLKTTVQAPDGDITFCSTHLDHRRPEEDRLAGVERMRDLLGNAMNAPLIVAGDFNAHPSSETCKRMATWLSDAWTLAGQGPGFSIPSEKPYARIDYVWTSAQCKAISARVPASDASDHLPVVVELKLR